MHQPIGKIGREQGAAFAVRVLHVVEEAFRENRQIDDFGLSLPPLSPIGLHFIIDVDVPVLLPADVLEQHQFCASFLDNFPKI